MKSFNSRDYFFCKLVSKKGKGKKLSTMEKVRQEEIRITKYVLHSSYDSSTRKVSVLLMNLKVPINAVSPVGMKSKAKMCPMMKIG